MCRLLFWEENIFAKKLKSTHLERKKSLDFPENLYLYG